MQTMYQRTRLPTLKGRPPAYRWGRSPERHMNEPLHIDQMECQMREMWQVLDGYRNNRGVNQRR